jgi:RES domain-containing protein
LIFPPDLLDQLQSLKVAPWEGIVYRHMLGDYPPERANTRGARWNPPEVAAVYTSLNRETALAEAEYRLGLEPFRPRIKRVIYAIRVKLLEVIDLSGREDLAKLGIAKTDFEGFDFTACQLIGGAAQWLGSDGMLVPSARHRGTNLVIYDLVIYEFNMSPEGEFAVISDEVLSE